MFRTLQIFILMACISFQAGSQNNNASYVNPFIGTGGHGHTFPGAVLPFGMVQLGPDTRTDGSWDGCSGYHYSDEKIYGFSHTHLSGTGVSDWGDILLMPTLGAPTIDPVQYASKFFHKDEKASPGHYEVFLDDDKIKAELTVTSRVGIHRYNFPLKTAEANLVLDLLHRDKTLNCAILLNDSVTISGFRTSEAWAKNQKVYYVIKFSKPYKKRAIANNGKFIERYGKFKIRPEVGVFTFELNEGEALMVKVGISPVSMEGAKKNLEAEAPHWDFKKYKDEAFETWNKQLTKIEVTEKNTDRLAVFYTALYHSCIHPSLNMDVDGQYRGRDDKIYKAEGFTNYSVFSLWDTYRALHPLLTILEPARTSDFINSFIQQFKQTGRLPMWELSSNETDCMIGFHAVSVILDAYKKGIRGFDVNQAYEAMKAAANYSLFGIPEFNKKGFLQVDDENESVSKTLEYGYDNWCIAEMATLLNKKTEAASFYKLSLGYRNLFDASTGFMRPRKNGNWLSPFDPAEINNHFTEGNSWQYSFYVPHDINGLIDLHGGKEKLEKKLDDLFSASIKTSGREQADVTGLMGQYAHGNEPSHHMAYLYNYVDKPEKTSDRVEKICNEFYKNEPDGLIGNEDCGQMSAWYIFSALGIYPVCPGSNEYAVSSPLFEEIKINFENGKFLRIVRNKNKQAINGLLINGKKQFMSSLSHKTLLEGGLIQFETEKNTGYGKGEFAPISRVPKAVKTIAAPLIQAPAQVLKSETVISMASSDPSEKIVFTSDGTEPNVNSKTYTAPIKIEKNAVLKAKAVQKGLTSASSEARFYKLKYDVDISLTVEASAQYQADGPQTLIDGIPSSTDWRKGNWLGFQGKDFECLIDLKQEKEMTQLSLNCLQDNRSWILFPSRVEFYTSLDGKTFTLLETVYNKVKMEDYKVQMQKFESAAGKKLSCRYIKIKAANAGPLPDWHLGKGGESYIFTDEIELK